MLVPGWERVVAGSRCSRRKSWPSVMLTAMAAAPLGVALSVGGVIFELHPPLFGVLWAKARSSSWTDNGGAIGVVTFLKALLLETKPSLGVGGRGWCGYVQEGELQGGRQAHVFGVSQLW